MNRHDATWNRIFEEHDALREELARTEALADEFRREGRSLLGSLAAQVESLLDQLHKHMDWEEDHLPPGSSDQLARLHREQRELLGDLVSDLRSGGRPPSMIAAHVAAIAGLLRRDFEDEERTLK